MSDTCSAFDNTVGMTVLLAAAMSTSNVSILRKKRFVLNHSLRVQSIMVSRSQWQGPEVAGQCFQGQEAEGNETLFSGSFLFIFILESKPMGYCCSHSGWVFHPLLNFSENALTDTPKVYSR